MIICCNNNVYLESIDFFSVQLFVFLQQFIQDQSQQQSAKLKGAPQSVPDHLLVILFA